MVYTTPGGRVFDVTTIQEQPFYSKKELLDSGGDLDFFDTTGKDDNTNMDSANKFSVSQSMIARRIQVNFLKTDLNAFVNDTELAFVAKAINKSTFQVKVNREDTFDTALGNVFITPTASFDNGWDSIARSLKGVIELNEPIIFGPGVPFNWVWRYFGTESLEELMLLFTVWGFLGIERPVTLPTVP